MHQWSHALAQGHRGVVRKHLRITPERSWAILERSQIERCGGLAQIVPRQQWLPATAQVLFYRSIVFLAACGTLQFQQIGGFRHRCEILTQAFLAVLWPPRRLWAPKLHLISR